MNERNTHRKIQSLPRNQNQTACYPYKIDEGKLLNIIWLLYLKDFYYLVWKHLTWVFRMFCMLQFKIRKSEIASLRDIVSCSWEGKLTACTLRRDTEALSPKDIFDIYCLLNFSNHLWIVVTAGMVFGIKLELLLAGISWNVFEPTRFLLAFLEQ